MEKAEVINSLRHRWQEFAQRSGIKANADSEFETLMAHYFEKHRGYHNGLHILEGLEDLSEVRTKLYYPDDLEMALWYHDVIYNPKSGENEEQSAKFMAQALERMQVASFIEPSSALIIATKNHNAQEHDAKYLVDIDFGILGKPWSRFQEYEAGIRQEYSESPDKVYNPKRKEIMQGFFAKSPLYKTEHFKQKYESQAKSNISRLVQGL